MRHTSFSAYIYAPKERVWKLMVDKIENPGYYLPGVLDVRIMERDDHTLMREIKAQGMFMMHCLNTPSFPDESLTALSQVPYKTR
jgi:hypothetical protein